NKNNPSEPLGFVTPTIKSRLLGRDNYDDNLVYRFLSKAHREGTWLICDCRKELDIETAPGLSVVLRKGHYHLRNLPSRSEHRSNCPFLYFKQTPWIQPERVAIKPAVTTSKEPNLYFSASWEEVNPAYLLYRLLEESGWTG